MRVLVVISRRTVVGYFHLDPWELNASDCFFHRQHVLTNDCSNDIKGQRVTTFIILVIQRSQELCFPKWLEKCTMLPPPLHKMLASVHLSLTFQKSQVSSIIGSREFWWETPHSTVFSAFIYIVKYVLFFIQTTNRIISFCILLIGLQT